MGGVKGISSEEKGQLFEGAEFEISNKYLIVHYGKVEGSELYPKKKVFDLGNVESFEWVDVKFASIKKCDSPQFEKCYNRMAFRCCECGYTVSVSGQSEKSVEDYVKEQHKKHYEN